MQFEFYSFKVTYPAFAEIEATYLEIKAKLLFSKEGFVKMMVYTTHGKYQDDLKISDTRALAKFFSYLDDLAALHPSPSWPREVETVWFEYVAWQRSLKNDE